MQNRLKSQAESLSNTQDKLTHMESEFTKVSELFRDATAELSGTKEQLQQTSGKLHDTRTNLKKTIEVCEGFQYVVKEYDQTEESLFSASSELLGVVKHVSGNIDKYVYLWILFYEGRILIRNLCTDWVN